MVQICPLVFTHFRTLSPGLENIGTFECVSDSFPGTLTYLSFLENSWNSAPMRSSSPIQGTMSWLVLEFQVPRIWECNLYLCFSHQISKKKSPPEILRNFTWNWPLANRSMHHLLEGRAFFWGLPQAGGPAVKNRLADQLLPNHCAQPRSLGFPGRCPGQAGWRCSGEAGGGLDCTWGCLKQAGCRCAGAWSSENLRSRKRLLRLNTESVRNTRRARNLSPDIVLWFCIWAGYLFYCVCVYQCLQDETVN